MIDGPAPAADLVWAYPGGTVVHVHCHAANPSIAPTQLDWLAADEHDRAARFHFPHDRSQFLWSRVLLRYHLGQATHRAPAELVFARSPQGKPHLGGGLESRIQFNLSHTDGAIAIAYGAGAIGVDIERHDARPFPPEVIGSVFSATEREHLLGLPAELRNRSAYAWWTCKEGLLKADGRGLGIEPAAVTISLERAIEQLSANDPLEWRQRLDDRPWCGAVRAVGSSWVCAVVREAAR